MSLSGSAFPTFHVTTYAATRTPRLGLAAAAIAAEKKKTQKKTANDAIAP